MSISPDDAGHLNKASNHMDKILQKLEEAKRQNIKNQSTPFASADTFTRLEQNGFKGLSPFSVDNSFKSLN